MRLVLLALAALASAAATATATTPEMAAPPALGMPEYREPARAWKSIEDARPSPEECRTRIEQVREQAGKPRLDRSPASPEKPLLIYAVDQRLQNCRVIVPVSDPSDLRQAPEPGLPELIHAVPSR